MKISKELFFEIKEFKEFDFYYCYDTENEVMEKGIECFYFICKEYSASQYMPISSKTTRQGGIAKIRKKIDNKKHSNTIFSTEYLHTEIEAVVKACQWILDNIKGIKC